MPFVVRVCTEADQASVDALQWPEPPDRRRLFGLLHTGALLETSLLSLCVVDGASGDRVVGFASFDDKVPASLSKWPEATEYLKKKVLFGRTNGCIMLSSFSQDPSVSHARVVAEIMHHLFETRPEVGGIVLPVPVGVDLEEVGLFHQAFACHDSVSISNGALFRFYRAVRIDYTPCVYVRNAHPNDTRPLQDIVEAQQMEWRLQDGASYQPWFNSATLGQTVGTQDDHHACYVAHSLTMQAPSGVLACTDAVEDTKAEDYAKLFSELYRSHTVPFSSTTTSGSRTASTRSYGAIGPPKIVLCGPTGSGKGTQSAALVDEFDVVPLSTGSMLRWHIEQGSALGLQAQSYLDSGELVPDELMMDMVMKRLNDDDCKARGWVLDGFPRTELQARIMAAQGALPDIVVAMSLADEDVLHRLCQRRLDPESGKLYHLETNPPPPSRADHVVQRLEDREDHVRRRLQAYHTHVEAVFQVFMKHAKLIHVDGARTKDSITRKLVRDVYYAKKMRRPFKVRHVPKLVIAGPPAGGKGTQCEWIVRAFNLVHLSTGDMLRAAIQSHAPLGMKAKSFMDAGELVPDELIIDLILNRLEQGDCVKRGWLLDGFPRTKAQVQAMLAKGIVPDAMLVLDVPDEDIVKRISGRVLDPDTGKTYHLSFNPPPTPDIADRCIQRSDDTPETVRVRLQGYHDNCDQVRAAFSGACEITVADGTQPIEIIAEQFFATIEKCLLRNNAFIVSLYSMSNDHECRAQQFLTQAFHDFQDKDCLLLALPEGCNRPVIATSFRSVRVDPKLSSVHRIQMRRGSNHAIADGSKRPPVSSKRRQLVLYAFHRDELPFLAFSGSELLLVDEFDNTVNAEDEGEKGDKVGELDEVRDAEENLVEVKGMGMWGLSRAMKSWTQRAFFGGKKSKAPTKSSKRSDKFSHRSDHN